MLLKLEGMITARLRVKVKSLLSWIFSKAFFLKLIWEVWVKLWEKQKFAVCNHLAHCKLMMGKFFLFPSLFPTLSHLLALSSSSSLFKVLTACSSSCWDVSWRSFCC